MRRSSRFGGLLGLFALVILGTAWSLPGCGDNANLPKFVQDSLSKVRTQQSGHAPGTPGTSSETHATSTAPYVPAAAPGETIRIGSFNIQVFGTTKMSKPGVMDVLAHVARQFDVMAIQEIRSKSDDIMPRFVDLINADGSHYEYLVGPRLGRTTSTEQYAFIYDATRIEFDPKFVYTIDDEDDLLHREPFIARFRVRGISPAETFTFSLVDIHTDPDVARQECDALAKVFQAVRSDGSGEDDVIVLGDLNVDEFHLGKLGALPDMTHAITGVATNTRGDKMYDNIVFHGPSTREFTGRTGVLDLQTQFGLTLQQALEVSDHMPVWAEFSAYESAPTGPVAGRPRSLPR